MNTKHYQYRIEFQARGAGHVHGVLWLDLTELEKDFPGIENIFQSIKANQNFSDQELDILEELLVGSSTQNGVMNVMIFMTSMS